MNAQDQISAVSPRMTEAKKKALKRLSIETIADLLYYFPARYENTSEVGTIKGIAPGEDVTIYGRIKSSKTGKTFKSRKPIAEASIEDGTGTIKAKWFSQPYIAKMLNPGMPIKVSGKVTGTEGKYYLANPKIEPISSVPADTHNTLFEGDPEEILYPIYSETKGVTSLWLFHAVKKAIQDGALKGLQDPIPEALLKKYNLPKLESALIWIHMPQKLSQAEAARKRFAFEEVFLIQTLMQKSKKEAEEQEALPVKVDRESLQSFIDSFPFTPTDAQTKAIEDIVDDFEKNHPMMRLVEGDVGSGKTAVAAATTYMVATSRPKGQDFGNLQVAYMVPTEILAKQHFKSFIQYFKDHPIKIGLITGKECYKFPSKINGEEATRISKAQLNKWVANGEIPIVIGTHALIQKSVTFKNLAYAIIDEQHRFGKVQRQKITRKDTVAPHLLSMTATPIPRTLALTIYGDLDLTLIDQMPTGRKPIITEVVRENEREKMYEKVKKQLEEGRQVYVICPRIDEPDPSKQTALMAKSVKAECARLKKDVFPDYNIDILHSKMSPAEKEGTMARFEKKEIDILVATSVVEVGVNVPNATVIIIEGAERFGLAQLHQLRGRVIRSNHQAYCYVYPESFGPTTEERLKALTTAKNGFELAEYDLSIRGGGELYGRRQWGVSDVAMEAIKNLKMVEAARNEAKALIKKDPSLTKHPIIKSRIEEKAEDLHFE
ncbi:MAG: ATP-dependent DNA helicase RecG [Patescibacteria group bacterium UBA2103]